MRRGRAEASAAARGVIRAGCESIELDANGDRAVLLLHGFGDTPQTLSYVAPELHASGITVRVPLLPGHGRSIEDFTASGAEDWLAAARDSLVELTRRYPHVGLGGLSMGGALAILLAAETRAVEALVLIAPYVKMPPLMAAAIVLQPLWQPVDRVMGSGTTRSIRDPIERARNLGYGRTTGRLLRELWLLGRRSRRALPRVRTPTLIVQSREDNRIRPRTAERVLARLGSAEKRLVLTAGAGHIITVDYGRDTVIAEVRGWFDAHLGAAVRSGK